MSLSETKVKNAKPHDKQYKIADGKGLFLVIAPNGSKYWRLRYFLNKKEKLLALGTYPEVTLGEAREKQREARKLLKNHIDPSLEKQKTVKSKKFALENTFGTIAKEWLAKKSGGWGELYNKKMQRRVEIHILPEIGHYPISEIKAPDLIALFQKICIQDKIETAQRVRNICSKVFSFAVGSSRAEHNPVHDIVDIFPSKKTKHLPSITDPKKIGILLHVIDGYEGHASTKAALKLSPLVFVRPGMIRFAEWSEIDFEAAEWRIPKEKMKMPTPHIVPLSKQALKILREIHLVTGKGKYVFPGVRGDRPISDNTVNAALRAMGYNTAEEMTGHGFRSMASTRLNEEGCWNRDAIERQLAHMERNSSRDAYNYAEYLPERRKMMQAWADYLDKLKEDARKRA